MTDCWNCLHYSLGTTPDENECSLRPRPCYDNMGDEDCPCYVPLPKGACCARCTHCDGLKTHCAKHNRPVYTPDSLPCRDYAPAREEDKQSDDNLPLLTWQDRKEDA